MRAFLVNWRARARHLRECARARAHGMRARKAPARAAFAGKVSVFRALAQHSENATTMRVGAPVQGTCTCHLHCRLVSHRARRRHARLRRLLCNDLPACRGAEPAGVALLRPLANESSFLSLEIMRLTFAINQADSCSSKSTSAA